MAMRPRLRLLMLLLLPAGCAPQPDGEAEALATTLENGRSNLVAFGAAPPPPARRADAPAQPGPAGSRPGSATQLVGAAPEALLRWLGEPALRRREGTAEIWLYAGTGCALDIVLYREGGALRVAHAAARANGATAQTEGACLRQLAGGAAARPEPAAATGRRQPGA